MGLFSWKTQDTDRSIPSSYSCRKPFAVYMHGFLNGEPVTFKEDNYEGYGVFGGKDFYTLVAEMNPKILEEKGVSLTGDSDKDRVEGINIFFQYDNPFYSPQLTEDPKPPLLLRDYRKAPEDCEYQGYFYPEDDEEY